MEEDDMCTFQKLLKDHFDIDYHSTKPNPVMTKRERIKRLFEILDRNESYHAKYSIGQHLIDILLSDKKCSDEYNFDWVTEIISLNLQSIGNCIKIKKNLNECLNVLTIHMTTGDTLSLMYYFVLKILLYFNVAENIIIFLNKTKFSYNITDPIKYTKWLKENLEFNNIFVEFLFNLCRKLMAFDPTYVNLENCISNLQMTEWDCLNPFLTYYDLIFNFSCCQSFAIDKTLNNLFQMRFFQKKQRDNNHVKFIKIFGHAYNCGNRYICSKEDIYVEHRKLNYGFGLRDINEYEDEFLSRICDMYYQFVHFNSEPKVDGENNKFPKPHPSILQYVQDCKKMLNLIIIDLRTFTIMVIQILEKMFSTLEYDTCKCKWKRITLKFISELTFLEKLCFQLKKFHWHNAFIYVEWLTFKIVDVASQIEKHLVPFFKNENSKKIVCFHDILRRAHEDIIKYGDLFRSIIYSMPKMPTKLIFTTERDMTKDISKNVFTNHFANVYIFKYDNECTCDLSLALKLMENVSASSFFLSLLHIHLWNNPKSIAFHNDQLLSFKKEEEILGEQVQLNENIAVTKPPLLEDDYLDKFLKVADDNFQKDEKICELKNKLKNSNKSLNEQIVRITDLKKESAKKSNIIEECKAQHKRALKENDLLMAALRRGEIEMKVLKEKTIVSELLRDSCKNCPNLKKENAQSKEKNSQLELMIAENEKRLNLSEKMIKTYDSKIIDLELSLKQKDQKIKMNYKSHERKESILNERSYIQNEEIAKLTSENNALKLSIQTLEPHILTGECKKVLKYYNYIITTLSKYCLMEPSNGNNVVATSLSGEDFKQIFKQHIERNKKLDIDIQNAIKSLKSFCQLELDHKENLSLLVESATNPFHCIKIFEEIAEAYFKLLETAKLFSTSQKVEENACNNVNDITNTNTSYWDSPQQWASFQSTNPTLTEQVPLSPPAEATFSRAVGGPVHSLKKPAGSSRNADNEYHNWLPGGKYHHLLSIIRESIPFCQDRVLINALMQVKKNNNNKLSYLSFNQIFNEVMIIYKRSMKPLEQVTPPEPCCICFEEFGKYLSKKLPCNHEFHRKCIIRWLELYSFCPLCKLHVTIVDLSS